MKFDREQLKRLVSDAISSVTVRMSWTSIFVALIKIRDGYFQLEVNQRLYINAFVLLVAFFFISFTFGLAESYSDISSPIQSDIQSEKTV
jgi:hypothetical protein